MAASNPQGEMQFWSIGQPFAGVKLGSNDGGEMQFWGTGQPFAFIFPASAASGPAGQKTWDGLATASISKMGGVNLSDVKTWNGLA